MFKKIFSLFAVACLACSFVACGGPGEAKKDENQAERKPPVKQGETPDGDKGDDTTKNIME